MSSWSDEQDWMVDSLSRYESLHMFELQQPTSCMEWTQRGTAVCVAGFSEEHVNEIVQLALPEKLLPPEHQSLWAKRDFKIINGAFSKSPVTHIKYIATADLIATAGKEACVCLWAGDAVSSDMLVKVGEITIPLGPTSTQDTLLDWSPSHPTRLLAGRSLTRTQLVDIHSKEVVYETSERPDSPSPSSSELHGLCFAGQDTGVFVTCSGSQGQLDLWDPRTPRAVLTTAPPGEVTHKTAEPQPAVTVGDPAVRNRGLLKGDTDSCRKTAVAAAKDTRKLDRSSKGPTSPFSSLEDDSHRTTAVSSEAPSRSTSPATPFSFYALAVSCDGYPRARCAVAEGSGRGGGVVMFDTRSVRLPVVGCSVVKPGQAMKRFASSRSYSHPCVQFSPTNSHRLSFSGVLEGVSLYDTATWSANMEAPPPLFTHQEHEQENPGSILLYHTWCPIPSHAPSPTILSADSAGSLHAWQWKDVCPD